MNNRQVLQMKYHPAKKEVTFSRVIAGKEIPINGDSRSVLAKYINKRGQFVLQDHGKQLFGDILEAFDGEEEVNLNVTMTKKDYEDFVQMVDFFNKTSEVKINVNFLAELPDMEATYEVVKRHGLESTEILKRNREAFYNVNSDNPNVHQCIDLFAKEINEATKVILDKIETLEQNSINVCFSGPYSSGKSLLINSLIGYAILPVSIKAETAAMFMISSPKPGEKVRINFHIADSEESFSELVWNEKDNMFGFVAGPSESKTRKTIQKTINACKDKAQFEQVHEILTALNSNAYVEREIKVFFPIAIDNERVQFTIYDTPGTDSDVTAHKNTLKNALLEQTHSILVFVTYPNGLSGGGNKELLEYLSEIENKADRSSIDLGRSLFVINYADILQEDEQFEAIRTGKISNEKNVENSKTNNLDKDKKIITIKLCDKKVFFTSAKFAYIAIAKKNGVATEREEKTLNMESAKILDDELGQYYRHDSCATSEYATQLLMEKCKREMEDAKDDLTRQIWVASGLYALEMEIREYGEKYASAVKAYSIIDGVDKALAKLDRNAQSIERQNSDDIRTVEAEIESIKKVISAEISDAKQGKEIGKNDPWPNGVVSDLRLDAASITKYVVSPADDGVDEILLGSFQKLGQKIAKKMEIQYEPAKTAWSSSKQSDIEQVIDNVLSDYTDHFKKKRRELLEKLRDEFIDDVRTSISNNGELSEEAKSYILAIETPEVEEFSGSYEFGELYKQKKKIKKVFWMNKEYLDRKSFIQDMNKKLRTITGELADNYKESYRNSLNNLLKKVESEFNLNMEKYSVSLKAKLEDKEAMEDLKERILTAAEELHDCQAKLDSVIWEVK